jgi:hypothetical protein
MIDRKCDLPSRVDTAAPGREAAAKGKHRTEVTEATEGDRVSTGQDRAPLGAGH